MKTTICNKLPTYSGNSWYILGSNKQVINGINQMFDVYSSHVVVISIFGTSTALYRHKVVVPGIKHYKHIAFTLLKLRNTLDDSTVYEKSAEYTFSHWHISLYRRTELAYKLDLASLFPGL